MAFSGGNLDVRSGQLAVQNPEYFMISSRELYYILKTV